MPTPKPLTDTMKTRLYARVMYRPMHRDTMRTRPPWVVGAIDCLTAIEEGRYDDAIEIILSEYGDNHRFSEAHEAAERKLRTLAAWVREAQERRP